MRLIHDGLDFLEGELLRTDAVPFGQHTASHTHPEGLRLSVQADRLEEPGA
jgi:hypothetical protein